MVCIDQNLLRVEFSLDAKPWEQRLHYTCMLMKGGPDCGKTGMQLLNVSMQMNLQLGIVPSKVLQRA